MTQPVLWSSAEAERATGGRATRPWAATGVSIDSRTLRPGDLFVALQGPNFDGHDFVAEALTKGAAAAVIARMPAEMTVQAPALIVADTLQALRGLAAAARARSRAIVIGVTGSVGKTGVKEALRTVLTAQGSTHASEGSLNNHWGLPLSLARLAADTAYAVFEMGMNHAGEIEPLSRLARPHVAIITTIAPAHIENLGSLEAIADAKAEIFAGMAKPGTAVLNGDNAQFARLAAAAASAGVDRVIAFGDAANAEARLLAARVDGDGADVEADVCGIRVAYRLNLPGSHWLLNSLAVLAAVHAAGADVPAAAGAFADVRSAKGRGERLRVPIAGGSFVILDDSYNANPASMAAAFEVLGYQQPGAGGRRIVVLGDMLELGEQAEAMHASLAKPITEQGIDHVFACGASMAALMKALPHALRAGYAATSAALAPQVAAFVRAGDVITVKGSAGSRMRVVVDALAAMALRAETAAHPPVNRAGGVHAL